jgi:hypothetical protein
LYIRRTDWWVQKHPIESFDKANNKITVGAPKYDPFWSNTDGWTTRKFYAHPGYGYFYKNHIAGLNLPREWVFSPVSKMLYLGLPVSSSGPSGISFGARKGIDIIGNNDLRPFSVTIKDIAIQNTGGDGINIAGINNSTTNTYTNGPINVEIRNVQLKNIGLTGINIFKSKRISIINSRIENTFSKAISISGFKKGEVYTKVENITIQNNTLISNGQLETQASAGMSGMSAIVISGVENATISENTISESGVSAISLGKLGQKVVVYKNSINGFSKLLNDAGAIYLNGQENSPSVDIRIIQNTVEGNLAEISGLPAHAKSAAACIYLDWATSNVKVHNNNLTNCYSKMGAIFVQSGSNNKIQHNTIMQSVNYPTIGFAHWNKNMIDPSGVVTGENGVTNTMQGNLVGENTLCTTRKGQLPQQNSGTGLTSSQVEALLKRYIPNAAKYLIQIHVQTMLPEGSMYYPVQVLPTI